LALCLLAACAPQSAVDQDPDGDGYMQGIDCDESDPDIHPGAGERCDGVDNDCDGETDEGLATSTWYPDVDGDGYGDGDMPADTCSVPEGYGADASDCDDLDSEIHPGAEERCNGLDDDCDGLKDEDAGELWYPDADGDGWGDEAAAQQACEAPSDHVGQAGDCDDQDGSVHPGAQESCDGQDEDCDGEIDEGVTGTWYLDADGDGYGDPDSPVQACVQPSDAVDDATDCEDDSYWVNPGVEDDCDGYDDDCDGVLDEDHKAGWLLLSVDTEAGVIWEIDPATGSTTELAPVSTGYDINSMDVHEDGMAIVNLFGRFSLGEIQACTGEVIQLGETGVGRMGGINFGPGGYLYGLDWDADALVRLDHSDGAGTEVGAVGFDLGHSGLAYDCATDSLWGADALTGQLFRVDASSGLAYDFVSVHLPFDQVGLEFDPASRTLLVATSDALYQVDPSTGKSAFIGDLDGSNFNDLAYYPPCQ